MKPFLIPMGADVSHHVVQTLLKNNYHISSVFWKSVPQDWYHSQW